MATLKRVPKLALAFDQMPQFAKNGGRLRHKCADIIACTPNKQNINPQKLIDSGVTSIDLNPGQLGHGVDYVNASACFKPADIGAAFPAGKNLNNASVEDCTTVAMNIVGGLAGTGAKILTSQAEEASEAERAAGHCLRNDFAASWQIEKEIYRLNAARGGIYTGMYDGAGRADILNRVSVNDLVSDAAILAFLRFSPAPGQEGVSTSGGGNKSFIPHTLLDGTQVRGAAEYRDVLFSTYAQGWYEPDFELATAMFQAMLFRQGLIAMADEISDSTRKAFVLARKIMNFGWMQSAQIGNNEAVLQRFKPPGLTGVTQAAFFMPNPVGAQRSIAINSLLETKVLYNWEDTTVYGDNPLIQLGYTSGGDRAAIMSEIASKTGWLNGQANGYIGNENVETGINVYKYTPVLPNGVKLGYTDRCLGNQDIIYSSLDAVGIVRGFVGESVVPAYASVKSIGESAFCDASNIRRYVYDRFKAKKGNGFTLSNNTAKRGAIVYNALHLRPDQTEQASVMINNTAVSLGTVRGGQSHEFLYEWQ